TIGIVEVATVAASEAGVLAPVTITLTFRRIRSATKSEYRSCGPSAQRDSIVTFWPSTLPDSFRASRKAIIRDPGSVSDNPERIMANPRHRRLPRPRRERPRGSHAADQHGELAALHTSPFQLSCNF